MSWKIGDVAVSRVAELEFPTPVDAFIPGATAADLDPFRSWMTPFLQDEATFLLSVHSFCVEADGLRMIVDTCVGNGKNFGERVPVFNDLNTAFLEDLTSAGFGRDSLDRVICTHLHMDHIGWNTIQDGGKWTPTFPNARYICSQVDLDFWGQHTEEMVGSSYNDAVKPLLDSGLLDPVGPEHRVSESISLIPTPGHTPGHVSVRISSQGQEAVITGDLIHTPAQLAKPEWSSLADTDGGVAAETRRRFLADFSDKPVLVLGTHFPAPTAGYLKKDPAGWRLES